VAREHLPTLPVVPALSAEDNSQKLISLLIVSCLRLKATTARRDEPQVTMTNLFEGSGYKAEGFTVLLHCIHLRTTIGNLMVPGS